MSSVVDDIISFLDKMVINDIDLDGDDCFVDDGDEGSDRVEQ